MISTLTPATPTVEALTTVLAELASSHDTTVRPSLPCTCPDGMTCVCTSFSIDPIKD